MAYILINKKKTYLFVRKLKVNSGSSAGTAPPIPVPTTGQLYPRGVKTN